MIFFLPRHAALPWAKMPIPLTHHVAVRQGYTLTFSQTVCPSAEAGLGDTTSLIIQLRLMLWAILCIWSKRCRSCLFRCFQHFLTVLDDAMFKEPPAQLLRLFPGWHLPLLQQPVDELRGHQRPLERPALLLPGLQQVVFCVHQPAARQYILQLVMFFPSVFTSMGLWFMLIKGSKLYTD